MNFYGEIGLQLFVNAVLWFGGYMLGKSSQSKKLVDSGYNLLLDNLKLQAKVWHLEGTLNELHKRDIKIQG